MFDKYSLFKVMEYSCSGLMSRCGMKGVLNLGTTTVAMLYVSLFNGKDAKVRVYSCSHMLCLAVQSKRLLKSGSTVVLSYLALQEASRGPVNACANRHKRGSSIVTRCVRQLPAPAAVSGSGAAPFTPD